MPLVSKAGRHLSLGLACLALLGTSGCGKKRIKGGYAAPSQTTGDAAKKVQIAEQSLPDATMTPREVRLALWDMSARQRKGDGRRALEEYAHRAENAQTLESSFLAAAAIPDLEAQWDAVHQLAQKTPKLFWPHAQMAAIYAAWKVPDHCERELAIAEALLPGVSYVSTIRGNLHRNLGNLALALESYEAALRLDETDADARTALALVKKQMTGKPGDLEAELKRSLADVTTHYESAEAIALLFDDEERSAEAKAAWIRVAELMPKNRAARLALARLAGDQDPAGAVAAYEQAAKIQPLTRAEQQSLAKLYQQVGRTEDEIKSLQALTKLDPKDVAPWRRLAAIYEARGDLPSMESTYNSLRALDGKDKQALIGLARVAERRLMLKQATELFREAVAAGDAGADSDVKRLRSSYLMPPKPLAGGNLTQFYRTALESLEGIYNERLKTAPEMKGTLRAKIVSDGEGKALSVDVVENTTGDPYIDAHLHYTLLEAAWPKLKAGERKAFTLKFDLPPEKN